MVTLEDVVREAKEWEKTPFHWGQSVKGIRGGCDCKGLVAGVARELQMPEGMSLEANIVGYRNIDSKQLISGLSRVLQTLPKKELIPGCVLLFNIRSKPQHLGIYIGNNRMVHCYGAGREQVLQVSLGTMWRQSLYSTYMWRSILGEGEISNGN